MTPTPDDVEAGWKVGGIIAAVLTGLGLARWGHRDHEKRISALEDSPEKITEDDCRRLQASCPVAVRLSAVEKQGDGLTAWLVRIEGKLDRLIEK